MDMIENDFGIEAFRMLKQAVHQLRALDAHRIAWPVLDVGRSHQLPPLLDTGDQHRLEVGARSIDGGAVTGWTGTENQDMGVFGNGHGLSEIKVWDDCFKTAKACSSRSRAPVCLADFEISGDGAHNINPLSELF